MSKLLVLDMSQKIGVILIYNGVSYDQVFFEDSEAAETITDKFNQINPDVVYLGYGPGRASGLRSSSAFVLGFCLTNNIKIKIFNSMLLPATMYYYLYSRADVNVVIYARMQKYFTAKFNFDVLNSKVFLIQNVQLVDSFFYTDIVSWGERNENIEGYFCDNLIAQAIFPYILWWENGRLAEDVVGNQISPLYLR